MADQQVQTQTEPQRPEVEQKTTGYMVLESAGGGNWAEVGVEEGVNAQAAIKASVRTEGRFVAIPMRSWKPLTRKTETVERDIWS